MRTSILFFLIVLGFNAEAQLFDNPENTRLVRKGVNYIYNVQPDSANMYIDSIEMSLPNHPAGSMMRALNILWTNIPLVTADTGFVAFSRYMEETIRRAIILDGGKQEHPEAIFFEMSARGFLAEYYADDDHYMRAFSEASKAYELIKKGFDLTDENPEFLITSGVYNYFREKYPDKYPVYKPLLWLFRSGDVELGMAQLKEATERAILTRAEAYIYLAYIYLRYEYHPDLAQSYLWALANQYPRNPYIKVKLLESLTYKDDFKKARLSMIDELAKSDRPYFQMAGDAFYGLHYEKVTGDREKALKFYRKAISAGSEIIGHGEYYRYLSYLGIGRIYYLKGDFSQARFHLEMVADNSTSEDLLKEAEELLDKL